MWTRISWEQGTSGVSAVRRVERLHISAYRAPTLQSKKNWVDSDAFKIQSWMKGLSVYRADVATPYDVLAARLDEARLQLQSEDETRRQKAQKFLANNPDVKTLVEQSQYRIVKIPIAAIRAMGFDNLEEPDAKGHLNILGNKEEFDACAEAFVELIDTGQARIITVEECLKRPDIE